MLTRKILIALALLLALTGAVVAQTDSDAETNPKRATAYSVFFVTHPSDCARGTWYSGGSFQWKAPAQAPNKYRIRWSSGRWNKAPSELRGKATVGGSETRFSFPGLWVECGKKLHIQVRALYKGEKSGPWSNKLKV